MWYATRRSVKAQTDEDVAMTYKNFGSYEDRESARVALMEGIQVEKAEWTFSSYDTDGYCRRRLDAILRILETGEDCAVVEGLQFKVHSSGASA